MKRENVAIKILIILLGLIPSNVFSQSHKVPPFHIIQANGRLFRANQLPIGKPIIIIYFSPECEDCQQLTKELINDKDKFEKASVVMITYLSKEKVLQFVLEYKLYKYSNFYIGTEEDTYFVGSYYNVGHLPFIALYNKNGDLKKVYDIGFSKQDLLNRLKDL